MSTISLEAVPAPSWLTRRLLFGSAAAAVALLVIHTYFFVSDTPGFVGFSVAAVAGKQFDPNDNATRLVAATTAMLGTALGVLSFLGLIALSRPPLVDTRGVLAEDTVAYSTIGRNYLMSIGLVLLVIRFMIWGDLQCSFAVFRVDNGPAQLLSHSALLALESTGAVVTDSHVFWDTTVLALIPTDIISVYYFHYTVKDSPAFRNRPAQLNRLCHVATVLVVVTYATTLSHGYFSMTEQPLIAQAIAACNLLVYVSVLSLSAWLLRTGWSSSTSDMATDPRTATVTKRACESVGVIFALTQCLNILQVVLLRPELFGDSTAIFGVVSTVTYLCKGLLPGAHFVILSAITALADAEMARRAEKREAAERVHGQALIVRYVCHEVRVPLQAVVAGVSVIADIIGLEDVVGGLTGGRESYGLLPRMDSAGDDGEKAEGKDADGSRSDGMWLTQEHVRETASGLQSMQRSCKAVRRILDDVLTLEKIGQGGLRIAYAPVNPSQLAEAVATTMYPLALERNVVLETSVTSASEWAKTMSVGAQGDEDRIEMVVRNLVSNALKFTEPGGRVLIRVHSSREYIPWRNMAPVVDAYQQTFDGLGSVVWVTFQVTDSGSGIEPGDFSHLFKPFHQLTSGAAFKEASTGLGLSICKSVVGLHGGAVGAWSDGSRRGSTFWAQFPLRIVDSPSSVAPDTSSMSELPRLTSGAVNQSMNDVGRRLTMPRPDSSSGSGSVDGASDGAIMLPTIQPMTSDAYTPMPPESPSAQTVAIPPHCERSLASVPGAPVDGRLRLPPVIGTVHQSMLDTAMDVPVASGRSSRQNTLSGPPTLSRGSGEVAQASSARSSSRRSPSDAVGRGESSSRAASLERSSASMERRVVVLVVEDIGSIRAFFVRTLRRFGYEAHEAENGAEGVDAVGKILNVLRPEKKKLVVLMDGTMPVMSGPDATEEIKRCHGDDVVVIAVTGNAREEDKERFIAAGAREVLAKPVTPSQLLALLNGIEETIVTR